jgi:hypothetical protein
VSEHPEFELLDAYAMGTLGEAESAHVRAHVESCPTCRAEAGELRSVLDVLPHGLPEVRASARVRERIFAQLDGPTPARRRRPPASFFAVAGLAAALLLAVGLDLWLAVALRHTQSQPAAPVVAVTSPSPPRTRSFSVPRRSSPPAVPRRPEAPPRPAGPRPVRTPGAQPAADPGLRRRIAELEASLTRERVAARRDSARDRDRIELLERQLADADASVVALERSRSASGTQTPQPVLSRVEAPVPSRVGAELVAALSTGRVYGVDGVVGSEPWHLTIVQPLAGKDAIIYTRTPDAPAGDTYRTWVLRGGTTFDAGVLPPDAQTELEMPMPLQSGDEVAFSREPVGTGDKPTSPFLMKVAIGP